jgi:hypothetical protein
MISFCEFRTSSFVTLLRIQESSSITQINGYNKAIFLQIYFLLNKIFRLYATYFKFMIDTWVI